jgi:hypothetical protein
VQTQLLSIYTRRRLHLQKRTLHLLGSDYTFWRLHLQESDFTFRMGDYTFKRVTTPSGEENISEEYKGASFCGLLPYQNSKELLHYSWTPIFC